VSKGRNPKNYKCLFFSLGMKFSFSTETGIMCQNIFTKIRKYHCFQAFSGMAGSFRMPEPKKPVIPGKIKKHVPVKTGNGMNIF
jgi:hypothetical protein